MDSPGNDEQQRRSTSDEGGNTAAWGPQLNELRAYLELFAAAQLDLLRSRARGAIVGIVLALVGGVAGTALIVGCVVLALRGMAGGLAVLLGDRLWAGELIVGLGLLLTLALAAKIYLLVQASAALRRTKEHYASRRTGIRREFAARTV